MESEQSGPSSKVSITSVAEVIDMDGIEKLISNLEVTPRQEWNNNIANSESQLAEITTGEGQEEQMTPDLLANLELIQGLFRTVIVPPTDEELYIEDCFPRKGAFVKVGVRGEKGGQTVFEDQDVEFFVGDGHVFGLPIGIDVGLTYFRLGEMSSLLFNNPALLLPIFAGRDVKDYEQYKYYVTLKDFQNLPEFPEEWTLQERLHLCDQLLLAANRLFKAKMESLPRAAEKYDLILQFLQDSPILLNSIPEEVKHRRKLVLYNAHLGLAKCFWTPELAQIMEEPHDYFGMEELNLVGGDDPVKYAKQALEICPHSFDALILLADINMSRKQPTEALAYYNQIEEQNWEHEKISLKMEHCRRTVREQEIEEAALAKRMFLTYR